MTAAASPRISVVLPVHDAPSRFVEEAVDSVLRQDVPAALEVVIVDDASHRDYSGIARRYANAPVHFVRHAANRGMVPTWNAAVALSVGPHVMLLGQDDVLLPGMFRAYLEAFDADPRIVLCACGREFIDEAGLAVVPHRFFNDRRHIFRQRERYTLTHYDVVRLCLRNGNVIGEPSAVMYRRAVFDAVGGYDPAFRHAADLDFNIRASTRGEIAYFREPFLRRRLHSASQTRANLRSGRVLEERVAIYKGHVSTCTFSRGDIASFRLYIAAAAFLDALRGGVSANLPLVRAGLGVMLRYLPVRPATLLSFIRALLSRANADAR